MHTYAAASCATPASDTNACMLVCVRDCLCFQKGGPFGRACLATVALDPFVCLSACLAVCARRATWCLALPLAPLTLLWPLIQTATRSQHQLTEQPQRWTRSMLRCSCRYCFVLHSTAWKDHVFCSTDLACSSLLLLRQVHMGALGHSKDTAWLHTWGSTPAHACPTYPGQHTGTHAQQPSCSDNLLCFQHGLLLLSCALQAELNVYEQFALQHCKGVVDPPAVCHEIEEAVLDLRHQLQLASKASVSLRLT